MTSTSKTTFLSSIWILPTSKSAAVNIIWMHKGPIVMNIVRSFAKRSLAFVFVLALSAPSFLFRAESESRGGGLTENQKILHVLNRLTFGVRPGDVEKVKAIGLQKYIEQQLDPSSINDAVADGKVRSLDTTNMTTSELFAKYPNPTALLRQLEGGRTAQTSTQPPAPQGANASAAPQQETEMTQAEQRERRQKINELYRKYDLKPAAQLVPQIVSNRVLRAVYSERQLQEVMVDFWQNHFNVFAGKAAVRWYIPSYERDVLRKNALGNFKDLVVGTARHPAMLFYLDNFQSTAPATQDAATTANRERLERMVQSGRPLPEQARERLKRQFSLDDAGLDQRLKEMRASGTVSLMPPQNQRGINENYARELMELHTLGVDGGYTQKDIVEVAKAFTGWTIVDPRGYRRAAASMIKGTEDERLNRVQRQAGIPDDVDSGEFVFIPRMHDKGSKSILGQTVNEGGVNDGLKVIDLLVAHPSTAKHIARKLAIKFVSDKPSEGLVNRVASAFTASKGDIKSTLRALFSDKEFFAAENYRAKIKTPFELAVSSIRAIGAETTAGPPMVAMLNKLGEVPYGYQAPTGYPDAAEDWVNTGALLERMNYAVAIASNRIPGSRVDLRAYNAKDKGKLLDAAITAILHGEISPATRFNLERQLKQPLPDVKPGMEKDGDGMDVPNMRSGQQGGGNQRQARLIEPSGDPEIFKVVSLVLGTPEFQRQ
jgi:uncharacterized protein (DUF1800 family)